MIWGAVMKYGRFEENEGQQMFNSSALNTQQNETEIKPKSKGKEFWEDILLYFHDIVYLLGVGLLLLLICFRIVVVSGDSMCNTLVDGDYVLLLSNTFYKEQKSGDIVVISKDSFENGAPIVKRVIATEHQTVDIDFDQGIVYVDGVMLDEPYVSSPTIIHEGLDFPLKVPEGCIFVMGDNRFVSQDSRNPTIGMIDSRMVIGKAILLMIPGTGGGTMDRDFSRFGVVN